MSSPISVPVHYPLIKSLTPPPSYQEAMGWLPSRSAEETTTMWTTNTRDHHTTDGNSSTQMICPLCHEVIETTTVIRRGMTAYVASLVVTFVTCGLGTCLVPYIINDFNEIHHSCPNCKSFLGTVLL
ncbi:cell death-inducing p53-target protein 1 [Drosophila elegans]|uniref:cell death-inducing p53-target protein 1 n=1 Tax=Drosophila elegans TaxID=30023 RepID=UPI0007E75C78|nr:cell death-inducing p53-target protein 1 [Drosophila elegans]